MSTLAARKDRKIAPRPPSSTNTSSSKHRSSASHQDPSSRSHRTGTGTGSSPQIDVDKLPRSVRHQSPEARLAIRRRQNNESAKRGRDERREEKEKMKSHLNESDQRIKKLESQVGDLEETLRAKRNVRKQGKSGGADRKPKPRASSGEFFQEEKFFGDAF